MISYPKEDAFLYQTKKHLNFYDCKENKVTKKLDLSEFEEFSLEFSETGERDDWREVQFDPTPDSTKMFTRARDSRIIWSVQTDFGGVGSTQVDKHVIATDSDAVALFKPLKDDICVVIICDREEP